MVLIVGSGCEKPLKNIKKTTKVKINSSVIEVELADTKDKIQKGLSGRKKICPDCGMLFIFPQKDIYSFWMKKMNFSLDIIWINEDKIVEMVEGAQVPNGDNIPVYVPSKKADKILEVNAGFCQKHDIKLGDKIIIYK